MNEDYKFEVGNLIRISPDAFDEQLPDFADIKNICHTRLFTIAERKVHWYTVLEEQCTTNWYRIPGYDWQGGDGWINEAWLTKWDGSGQLQLTVTLSPEGQTREAVEAEARVMLENIRDIAEGLGIPREAISKAAIRYDNEPAIDLDMVG